MPGRIWFILIAVTLTRVSFGIQFQSIPAVGPMLVDALGLTYAALGILIGAYSIPGIVIAFPGSWLLARLGNRRTLVIALGLMTVGGMLASAAIGFAVLLIGRVVSGAGYVLLLVVSQKIILDYVPSKALGMAMGFHILGYPLGVAVAMSALPFLGAWQVALLTSALICAAAGAIAVLALPRQPDVSGELATMPFHLDSGSWAPLITIALTWAFSSVQFAMMLGFLPPFFVAQGMTVPQAAGLTGLLAYSGAPLLPFGAWLLMRATGTAPGILICLSGFAAVPALLTLPLAPIPLLILGSLAISACAGPIFAMVGAPLRAEERALAMGIFYTILHAAMTLLPPLGGLARDLTGNPAAPLYVASLFGLVALLGQISHTLIDRPKGQSPPAPRPNRPS